MINKELELTINKQKILENLATNLNISSINENTAIKKIADSFEAEMRNYSDATENAIRNSFITTMDEDLLENFAANFGLYRKRYSNIRIRASDRTVKISVNSKLIFSKNATNFTPFRKGDTLYSNDAFSIKALGDITFTTAQSEVFPDLEFRLRSDKESFTVYSDTTYTVPPVQSGVQTLVPFFNVFIEDTIGMAIAEESVDDFRLRIYESTYLANNSANSLMTAITKDVPLLYYIESEDIDKGRAISVVYPYTYTSIVNGSDPLLSTIVIPMIETSLATKSFYSNMIKVKEPQAINLIAKFKYKNTLIPTQSVLTAITREFNILFFNDKRVSASQLKTLLVQSLFRYEVSRSDIDLYFINANISEEGLLLDEEEYIDISIGRYLNLVALEGIVNE